MLLNASSHQTTSRSRGITSLVHSRDRCSFSEIRPHAAERVTVARLVPFLTDVTVQGVVLYHIQPTRHHIHGIYASDQRKYGYTVSVSPLFLQRRNRILRGSQSSEISSNITASGCSIRTVVLIDLPPRLARRSQLLSTLLPTSSWSRMSLLRAT
jgi:hypothetical protein